MPTSVNSAGHSHSSGSFNVLTPYDEGYQYSRAGIPGTGVGAALSAIATSARDAYNGIASRVSDALNNSANPGVQGGAGSDAVAQPGGSPFVVKDGKVQFKDKDMQRAMQMIQQISRENNEWSAQQAQKQMDFQLMMSNTAHQREVEDLKAAGLNPVLSSGGPGASTTSGAMGQTDTSNTNLIAELAMGAINAMSATAVGVAGAAGSGSGSRFQLPSFVQRALNNFGGAAGNYAGRQFARWAVRAISKL